MEQIIKDYFHHHMIGTIKEMKQVEPWDQGRRYSVILRFVTTRAFVVYEQDGNIVSIKEYHKHAGFTTIL